MSQNMWCLTRLPPRTIRNPRMMGLLKSGSTVGPTVMIISISNRALHRTSFEPFLPLSADQSGDRTG